MPNIVIASDDKLCQSAKEWFIKYQKCIDNPSKIDTLDDGDLLYIIAHDNELGDATQLIKYLSQFDMPVKNFRILLIVCSAAGYDYEKDLLTPAERIANHFRRPVWASKTVVTGIWNDDGATFKGDYIVVEPDSDITSLLEKLKI